MISQDFWQTNFWNTCRKTRIVRLLGRIYRFSLKIKHLFLSKILCPYYAFRAKSFQIKNEPYDFGEVFVSLTSYPARIKESYYAICSLLVQTQPANKIILTLTKEEFPKGEDSLPKEIIQLKNKGLEILWADENLKPHNKYFYSMQKYPKAIIITADDDILYPYKTIEKLLNSFKQHPHAVSGLCTDKLFFENNNIKPYSQAAYCYDVYVQEPRFDLMIEGFAGALYPPSILPKEAFNKEKIKQCAPIADDLWLKIMELLNHIPVVCAAKYQDPTMISSSQITALFKLNNDLFENDRQLQKLIEEYKNRGILDFFK